MANPQHPAQIERWKRLREAARSDFEGEPAEPSERRSPPLVWGPAVIVYLVTVACIFVYLHLNHLHPCIPAFVVLGGVTAVVWYEMLFWNRTTTLKRGVPNVVPSVKVIIAWLAYGLLFRGRGDVFPELTIVLSGMLAVIFVVFSYIKMVYQKIYANKFMAQIYLLAILFVPSSDINVAPDMETGLVILKVTAFYVIYALSELESIRTEDTGNPYYGSVERRIVQSLWVLMTWSYAFAAFFSVLQISAITWKIYLSWSGGSGGVVVDDMATNKKEDDLPVQQDVETGQQPPPSRSQSRTPPPRQHQPPAPERRSSPLPAQRRPHPNRYVPRPARSRGRGRGYPPRSQQRGRNGMRPYHPRPSRQRPSSVGRGGGGSQLLHINSAIQAAKTMPHPQRRTDVSTFRDD